MVATFTQYSFLVGVALANLSLGFAAACYLGWAPRVKALGMSWLTDVVEQPQGPGETADAARWRNGLAASVPPACSASEMQEAERPNTLTEAPS